MGKNIDVSIIIPVRTDNQYLDSSLSSTLSSMSDSMELVIVEDLADEKASKKISTFFEQNKHRFSISVLSNQGKGLVDALHTGISNSSGTFIARMDADDICLGERFTVQQKYLEEHSDIGLVSCLVKYGGDELQNAGFSRFVKQMNTLDTHRKMYEKRYVDVPVAHPSVMFRRSLLKLGTYRKCNKFGETVPEDFDLWLRWLNHGVKFEKIPEYLLIWNDLPDRLSRKSIVYSKRAFWNSVAENFIKAKNKNYWICGYGRSADRRLRGLVSRGLTISGYIAPEPQKRKDGLPVISIHNMNSLKGNAIILCSVGNYEGKKFIQTYFNTWGFEEETDYIWIV
ncbi:glycosyltransferase [Algoriphagus persicinus]|uniref:glycosyltransferase n=1 Tax=Algoriphagus persicinus TaxID=3108754 RepID=UPI002B36781A|nr:glycosyltransferase [Algoriphagus sp. E1-3-M2]MEB2785239.1 glycosyltransferase [Algoriphagus sp. E1-3-M2]